MKQEGKTNSFSYHFFKIYFVPNKKTTFVFLKYEFQSF
jgi:hypothetical protein